MESVGYLFPTESVNKDVRQMVLEDYIYGREDFCLMLLVNLLCIDYFLFYFMLLVSYALSILRFF